MTNAQLLREAARQLRLHNEDYHHRTPDDFITKLEAAGVGVLNKEADRG